ncbi:hypothetical protein D3C81_1533890 [compost metagenome]
MSAKQACFEKGAAILDGQGNSPGVAHLCDTRQVGQQRVSTGADLNGQLLTAPEVLQCCQQTLQGALTRLLGRQLLGQCKVVEALIQRYEAQRLTSLYLGTEQAAQLQWARAVQDHCGAGLGGIEQGYPGTVDRRQPRPLGKQLTGHDLALQQGTEGYLSSIEFGEGGNTGTVRLLHGDRQAVGGRLGHGQLHTRCQWCACAGRWPRDAVDFACHSVTTCRNCPLCSRT